MSDVAVRVEGLGKRYKLGGRGQPAYKSLRESLMNAATAPFRGGRNGEDTGDGERAFWALKDVSFEVKHGEVLGIIGRNGAGKSTLLKILSRITEPTAGYADVYGRVGALLEVGTGFHPELTGAENIYLSGAILGMSRDDIKRRFDEIVAFAELEQFLETPVKRYSSGMYMRLAFSVAAHLEPEVLVVDEVLAVGDSQFQQKCLGRMGEVASEGRTVLFVSHNMPAIRYLCSHAVLLVAGQVVAAARTDSVLDRYLGDSQAPGSNEIRNYERRQGRGTVRFTAVRFEDENGEVINQGEAGKPLVIALDYRAEPGRSGEVLRNARISAAVHDTMGQVLFNCSSELTSTEVLTLPRIGTVQCHIPRLPLSGGQYLLSPFLEVDREIEDWLDGAVRLPVVDGDFFGSGRLYPDGWGGKGVLVPHWWVAADAPLPPSPHSAGVRHSLLGAKP